MSDPEIITLSSDEDTKPMVRMQFSKRKRGKCDVNPTAKKIALQFQASSSSKTQNIQNCHQPLLRPSLKAKNDTKKVALPVYKHQNTTQSSNIHNQQLYSKISSSSSQQKYKDGKSPSYVSQKQLGNTKSVHHLQNQHKSNSVSNYFQSFRTSTPKNSTMNIKNSRTSVSDNFIQKSNGMQSKNSNKMNIPQSVLRALQEKGISITNVDEKPKPIVAVCNKQSESQKYLDKLRSSLSKSNTNINVVSKANTAPSFSTFLKANDISSGNVPGLKNTVKESSYNLNKYQNEKKVLPSTQSVPNKSAKDMPFKFSSEIKIIEKPAAVTKSVIAVNDKKFIHNSSQKDILCFPKPSSGSSQLTKKNSTPGSLIQIPSKPLSIIPVTKPKNNFDKSVFPPEINIIKVDNCKQNKKAATPSFTSVPTSNSSTSIRKLNSSVKYASNRNNKSSEVIQKSSLQPNRKKCKPHVTKNVDLSDGNDILSTLLSLCDDTKEKTTSYVTPTTYTSNSELSIVPVMPKSSVCHSETKLNSPLIKSMKVKDVASETKNWPRLIVSLERLDIYNTCIKKKICIPKIFTGSFDLSEVDNKYCNEQELKESSEKVATDCHSVKSDNDHLSTSRSGDKTASSVVLKNSITCISTPDVVTGELNLSETDDKHSNEQELEECTKNISADYHSLKSEDDHLLTSISVNKTESSVDLMNTVDTCNSVPEMITGALSLSEIDDKHSNEQELEEFGEKIPAENHSVKSEDDYLPTSISGDKIESSVVLTNSVDTCISDLKTATGTFDLSEIGDKHSNKKQLEEFHAKVSDNHSAKSEDVHLPTSISEDKTECSALLMNSVDSCVSAPKTVTGSFDLPDTHKEYSNGQELVNFGKKMSADYHSDKSEDDNLPTSISGDNAESSVLLMNSVDTCISVPKISTETFGLSETDNKHLNKQELEEVCEKISDCHSAISADDHLSTNISSDKSESLEVLGNSIDVCISVPKTVTGAFDVSETDDKYSNVQELVDCEKMSVGYHSVEPKDDHLSTSFPGDKTESLKNPVDTCISVFKSVSASSAFSETDNKYSNEQELKEFNEKVSTDYHSVTSKDDHLSTGISGDKAEFSLVSMNSISTYFSDDNRDKNSKSCKNLQTSVCTISHVLKANTVTETIDTSSHVASLDSVMKFTEGNSNIFEAVDFLNVRDPSQCTKMEMLPENSSKNCGNLLANPKLNDITKAKSIVQSDIDNNFIPNCDIINSMEVRNLLNSIILKICNMQLKEQQNTCMEVLNIIISTIENVSDSLLTETEIVTNIQRACLESNKHTPKEKICNLLNDNVVEDIEKRSTDVHSNVDNNHCVEIYKEKKSLSFHVSPYIEKESDSLTVPNHLLKESNISMPIDENINIQDRTDVKTNTDIILSKESPKEISNKTNLNLTVEKNTYLENKIICDESYLQISDNTERLSFNYNVIEQEVNRSEISESVTSDNEMDFTISSQIDVDESSCSDNEMDFTISNQIVADEFNQRKSSKDDACFQDDNAVISISPLRENGALSCIIVQVESRQDLFTEEEQHFEDDSEFKQNFSIEQDNISFNNEEPEPCRTLFSFTEDTSTSEKYACAFTDDEGKSTLNQADSTQVTSPKLSLKRNRSIESPDGKLLANNKEYFVNNGLKRIKLNESILSVGQETSSSSDKNSVPLYETLKEKNNRKFMELLEYSKVLMAEDSSEYEKNKIVEIMKKKLGETQAWYASSEKFSSLIENSTNKLKKVGKNSGEDVFTILSEMRVEFRNYKRRSRFGVNRENSQDTNLASSSVSNDFIEVNNSAIKTETSTSENIISTFRINTGEIETSSRTSLPDIYKPKSSETCVFVNNTVDKVSPDLEPVLPSAVESSNLKNDISDNHLNSVATSSTSEHNSSTSSSSMQLITKSNISDKVKTNSSDLSSKLQSLNSHEPLTAVDGIADRNLYLLPSTSKDETYSYKDSIYSSKNGTKADTNCSNKQRQGIVNSNISALLPADKINHAVSVLNKKRVVKKEKVDKKEKIDKEEKTDKEEKLSRQIQRLEKTLKKLDKRIKKLQEKELTLDDLDDEDSVYIKEARYKKRFKVVWNLLCKLKKQSTRTGRVVDKKFKYEGSRYKTINVAVEKMINKREPHEKFPDYVEVLTLIKQVNEYENIGLNEKHTEIEAENIFRDIGKELQSRRCRDYEDLLGCHLTDNFDPVDDPAEHDETLKKILSENKRSFEQSINQVIDSYVEKQLVTPEDEGNQDNSSEEEDDQEEEDKDLPLTDPGSPNSDSMDSSKNDVTEIVNDSDKSTDPNEEIMKKENVKAESNDTEVNSINVESNKKLYLESIVLDDSNSSDDLPSIQDVISLR